METRLEPRPITRRAKLYAKLCWPEIDTQRTKFVLTPDDAPRYYLAVPKANPNPFDRIGIETVEIQKWVAMGQRRHVVARWGYSPLLDTVVIRSVVSSRIG